MSSSSDGLSQEEFLRLQEQLIELRNANYELKEKLKYAQPSNNEQATKKDPLQFATRLLNRSLTEKERETQQRLEGENEDLRAKLLQQEDEFRLQQQTFIAELNKVVRQCEELQKELENNRGENSEEGGETLEDLLEERKLWAAEKTTLEGVVLELRNKFDSLTTELEEQTVCVKALENTVLEVRRENERLMLKNAEVLEEKEEEVHRAQENIRRLENEISQMKEGRESKERLLEELQGKLCCLGQETETLKKAAIEAKKEVQSSRELLIKEKKVKEDLLAQINEEKERQKVSLASLAESHRMELDRLRIEHDQEHAEQLQKLRSQLEEQESKKGEVVSRIEEKYRREREALEQKIVELESRVGTKDEEKQLALKKQSMLVKELQKALKEEKRRAESVEKAKEREWQVVDPDARSSNTYDGNESISSLSALESDNVELINKLSTLQKTYADAVDKVRHLEHENETQQREILEKSEVIESWIRCRPMPSAPGTQKAENPLRKFLANTLAGDEVVTDLKEMNRKLQRMLEETLSKNIILQRDLQTLIERTEM